MDTRDTLPPTNIEWKFEGTPLSVAMLVERRVRGSLVKIHGQIEIPLRFHWLSLQI